MIKYKGYKIAILALAFIIILQWVFIIIRITGRKKITKPPEAIKGKIAIVIDDWGYNANNLPVAAEIKYPFTAAVLPGLAYSKLVATEFHNRGIEVILHLPMEPLEKFRLERNTIMAAMDEQSIKNIIEQDLTDIKYAVGVSNHMGSKATQDSRAMGIVLAELKKRNLFFLDSLVSSESICESLAGKIRLRFVKRDVFLDNQEDVGYVRRQVYKLKMKARAYGQAVGIGHDRKITLEALKETMPELEKEGYRLVFVSDLAR